MLGSFVETRLISKGERAQGRGWTRESGALQAANPLPQGPVATLLPHPAMPDAQPFPSIIGCGRSGCFWSKVWRRLLGLGWLKGNSLSMQSGVKLETGFSPTFPSPGGSTVSRGPDTLGSRAEGIPRGAGQSTWFNWPREPSPPLDCSPTRTKPGRTLDPCVWGGAG